VILHRFVVFSVNYALDKASAINDIGSGVTGRYFGANFLYK
jgi:hypothetical protein